MAVIIWYNETKHSEAYDKLTSTNKFLSYSDSLNKALVNSQSFFNNYIINNDNVSLKEYAFELNKINFFLDSLKYESDKKNNLKKVLTDKQKVGTEILRIKKSIDSIISGQTSFLADNKIKSFTFRPFEINNVLDNVKKDSYIKVDSVSKKRFLTRIGDAIAGRVNVQKEYLNTVVTVQYKDKISKGTIEKQITSALDYANKYYSNEFSNLRESFSNLRSNDLKLMKLNSELIRLTQEKVSQYNLASNLFQKNSQKKIQNDLETSKQVRNYTLLFLILLMIVISILLFNFTKIAFDYEKRLITAQNQIKQSLDFKNRITGMISHEIRSPLNIIALYSRKARASTKDDEQKETFKSIEFTTNSLLLLSNQILEYSREKNYQLKLNNKKIYLQKEINQIIVSMKSLLETKGNKLVLESNLEPECQVYADVGKIYQLFYNIIGNANKFTNNGVVKVKMELSAITDYEMNLDVIIVDNGIGIAKEDLKNLFESYYQGIVSEKVNNLGVGLGLNICKEIVELFEGKIIVESKVEHGTKVAFNLIITQI